jgi:hypothetical protein
MLVKPFIGDYKLNTKNLFGANPQYYKQFLVKHPDGTRKPLIGHNGIDWILPSGTIIVSPISGTVIESGFDELGYGNYLKIENATCGVVLGHLERVEVSVGMEVQQSQRIATSDNTGYSTGPHLHEGFYLMPRDRSNGYGGFIDPVPYHTDINPQTYEVIGSNVSIGGLPKETRPVEEAQLYTATEYNACMTDREAFWKQRDEAVTKLEEKKKEFNELNSIYSEIKALGYESANAIQQKMDEKDEAINSLQTQLTQTLNRNAVLSAELEKKDKEDATAIDLGISAMRENKELQNQIREITKTVGVEIGKSQWDFFNLISE